MGQKINPNSMRLGIVRNWNSRYFTSDKKTLSEWVVQDKLIRNYFSKFNKIWSLSLIDIERNVGVLKIKILTAKPGIVLGQESANIKKIEKEISRIVKDKKTKLKIQVEEVSNPDFDAKIIANEIASQLERRVPFRVAQKKIIRRVMRSGVKGIKTQVSGRLNGVDMARTEGYLEGQVPLQTLRNDIDYAVAEAKTTYGIIGIKVWISKGEILSRSRGAYLNKPEIEPKKTSFKKNFKKPYEKKEENRGEN